MISNALDAKKLSDTFHKDIRKSLIESVLERVTKNATNGLRYLYVFEGIEYFSGAEMLHLINLQFKVSYDNNDCWTISWEDAMTPEQQEQFNLQQDL